MAHFDSAPFEEVDDSSFRVAPPPRSSKVAVAGHRQVAAAGRRSPLRGRERALEGIALEIAGGRALVTITGAGGVGKTTIAVAAVDRALQTRSFDHVWFCEMASVRSGHEAAELVAHELGLALDGGDPVERVGRAFERAGDCLLVLDNLEQFVEEAAGVVRQWLGRAPRLQCLATSRELLRISEETVIDLGPLSVEGLADEPSAAVQLLIDRTASFRGELAWSRREIEVLAEIARRVDGVPLALVLAAGRLRHMPPAELLHRLDSMLGALTGAPRDLPVRHMTMRATLEWSWNLLPEAAAAALSSLSVFRGGFDPAAAQAVLGPDTNAEEVLGVLQDRSLVRRVDVSDERRLDLLAPIREYAGERLVEGGCADAAVRRHAAHFLGVAASLRPDWAHIDMPRNERDPDLDNYASAVDHALGGAAPPELVARALPGLATAILAGGSVGTWRARIERLLAERLDGGDRARALFVLGVLVRVGARGRAEVLFGEACELAEVAGEKELMAASLNFRACCRLGLGRADDVISMLERVTRVSGDAALRSRARREWAVALAYGGAFDDAKRLAYEVLAERPRADSLFIVGHVLALSGDLVGARDAFVRVPQEIVSQNLGATYTAQCASGAYYNLACLELDEGRYEAALLAADACRNVSRFITQPERVARAHAKVGAAHYLLGDLDSAAKSLTECIAIVEEAGIPERSALYRAYAGAIAASRGRLTEATAIFTALDAAELPEELHAAIAPLRVPWVVARKEADRLRVARDLVETAKGDEARFPAFAHEIRLGRRIASAAIAAISLQHGNGKPLEIRDQGALVCLGDEQRIDLGQRPVLARLLFALASGSPFPVAGEALISAGWPGERLVRDTGLVRLRVAIAALRRLGLHDRIVTGKVGHQTGYALEGAITIHDA